MGQVRRGCATRRCPAGDREAIRREGGPQLRFSVPLSAEPCLFSARRAFSCAASSTPWAISTSSSGRLNCSGSSFSDRGPNFSRRNSPTMLSSRRCASTASASAASVSARRAFRRAFSSARAVAVMTAIKHMGARAAISKERQSHSAAAIPPVPAAARARGGQAASRAPRTAPRTARETSSSRRPAPWARRTSPLPGACGPERCLSPSPFRMGLPREPVEALRQDVRAVLLDSVAPFFARDAVAQEEPVERRGRRIHAAPSKLGAEPFAREIRRFLHRGRGCPGMRLDPPRPRVAALSHRAKEPARRRSSSHRIAAEGATPYRAAASRRLMPASIAAITRHRKSMESGLPILNPDICLGITEPDHAPTGKPHSIQTGGEMF